MASHQQPKLSFIERIFLVKHALGLVARTVLGILGFIPYVLSGSWPLKKACAIAFVRADAFSLRERYSFSPTTGSEVKDLCKAQSLPVKSMLLAGKSGIPDATLHMIDVSGGKTGDGKALLYLHGGGYVFPLMGSSQLAFQIDCARAAGAHRLAVLEYTLAPELKYPGQLVQAVAALQYLLDEQKIRPDQIILTGDSAGGNLVMAVLAHIQEPHPEVPAVVGVSKESGKQFDGALLLSPWVGITYTKPSYVENGKYDIIVSSEMLWLNDEWGCRSETWADSMSAPASYWEGLPVKDMLLTAGTWEIFRDDIYSLYDKLKAGGVNVSLVEGKTEVHNQPSVDKGLGLRPSTSTVKSLEWMAKRRQYGWHLNEYYRWLS